MMFVPQNALCSANYAIYLTTRYMPFIWCYYFLTVLHLEWLPEYQNSQKSLRGPHWGSLQRSLILPSWWGGGTSPPQEPCPLWASPWCPPDFEADLRHGYYRKNTTPYHRWSFCVLLFTV